MLKHSNCTLAAMILTIALNAQADTTVVFADVGDGHSKAVGKVEISKGRMRSSSPGDGSAYMIFDAGADHFTMIDVERRSYMVFDQQQIQALVSMQKRAMEQMEATVANMPAAQREQMRKMMKGMMGGGQTSGEREPHRYVRSGKTDTVAGHSCEVLEVYAGDNKIAEQCVVGRKQLGFPDEDFRTMQAMQDFSVKLVSQFPKVDEQMMEYGEPGHDEMPVRYSHYSKMTATNSGELRSISFEAIDAKRFEIPKGFKRQKMPGM